MTRRIVKKDNHYVGCVELKQVALWRWSEAFEAAF
jgi:hypothetical protein